MAETPSFIKQLDSYLIFLDAYLLFTHLTRIQRFV